MAKLLETRLPLALTEVDANIFNRLVKISTFAFNAGDVIWNTSIGVLQVYTGNSWLQLQTPVSPHGYQANAQLGVVSIKTNGDITLTL